MFQAEVKAEFVKRYCPPANGYAVFVDIDPSERGATGGQRKSSEARERQGQMHQAGECAEESLKNLGVQVGGSRSDWFRKIASQHRQAPPPIQGDRDIVAIHFGEKRVLIAEVEGESSAQPEQKLYKAIGQIVVALDNKIPDGWRSSFVLVVYGDKMKRHLRKASILASINVAGLAIAVDAADDEWLFRPSCP
ncbi:MAG: hypothetical protein IMZ65_00530 [Planctomycetes bacterium]|nr:hypothetical protein [Planctomycetota bacterium]